MEGWISTYRQILDNPVVCKDSDYFSVWMYLLLSATHKCVSAIFNKQKITLKPGQLITGRKTIADKFNISESKVQRILKTFEIEHQIEQQTSSKNRLISIIKWNEYQKNEQEFEQPVNNERTTNEQPVNTNNNDNNVNNDNNNYLYLFNKYKKQFSFFQSMREKQEIFKCTCARDKKYKELTEKEQAELYTSLISIN